MKKRFTLIITLLSFLVVAELKAQRSDISPQLWSNLFVGWGANEKFRLTGDLAYNVLLSDEAPWSEVTSSVSGVYTFRRFMEATAGIYLASANQSADLRSNEYRPFLGFRIFTNSTKRWMVTNFSRIEVRAFRYSDGDRDLTVRFRNRTYAIVSLNKHTMTDNRNVMLFGYFEFFYNFEQEVRERFFNQSKYKLGFVYRHNHSWSFNIGIIYQNAFDNVDQPVQLPVTVVTNWVLEWGIGYFIPQKKSE